MLGFHAQALSSEIALIDGELEEARWFDRRELVSRDLLLPPAVSISYRLIQSWYDSRPGHHLARDAGPARDW
jgi:NAD+ diphosphatase